MPLTPLNDFASGTATNASDMNDNFTTIENEWDEDRILTELDTKEFAAASTSSATYVDTNITQTIITSGLSTVFAIGYHGARQDNDGGGLIQGHRLLIDGSNAGEMTWNNNADASSVQVCIPGFIREVAAGSVICKIQYKATGGTVHQEASGGIIAWEVKE